MLKGGEHFPLESLVMKVKGMDNFGRAAALGATDSGQHGLEDFFAEDKSPPILGGQPQHATEPERDTKGEALG
jgi:hypothetical protein